MLAVVFVLSCMCLPDMASTAYPYTAKCSEQAGEYMTFTQSKDDVIGRYTVEYCTGVEPTVTKWDLSLDYKDSTHCVKSRNPGQPHSWVEIEEINQTIKDLNCTDNNVCLLANFEMVFNSCYQLTSTLYYNGRESSPHISVHNVTKSKSFNYFNGNAEVSSSSNENDTSIQFFLSAPPNNYSVNLCAANSSYDDVKACRSVSRACAARGARVRCAVRAAPGCHSLWLSLHDVPLNWIFKKHANILYDFCREAADSPVVSGASWRVAWACGGVALATAAALLAWRRHAAARLHKRVLSYWRNYRSEAAGATGEEAEMGGGGGGGVAPVLLLYAREAEGAGGAGRAVEGAAVGAALRALLRRALRAPVWDVFAADTAAAAARAPAEWLRRALARPDVRVLLLQTPALAHLYAAPRPAPSDCDHAAPKLAAPLLARGGAPRGGAPRGGARAPHFGDALLPLALRLLADAPPAPHAPPAYRKYYLATLSDLPVDIFPHVVPYKRYELPEATPLLLSDLLSPLVPGEAPRAPGEAPRPGPGAPDEDLSLRQAELTQAIAEFVEYVRDNPNYLTDDLVMM